MNNSGTLTVEVLPKSTTYKRFSKLRKKPPDWVAFLFVCFIKGARI